MCWKGVSWHIEKENDDDGKCLDGDDSSRGLFGIQGHEESLDRMFSFFSLLPSSSYRVMSCHQVLLSDLRQEILETEREKDRPKVAETRRKVNSWKSRRGKTIAVCLSNFLSSGLQIIDTLSCYKRCQSGATRLFWFTFLCSSFLPSALLSTESQKRDDDAFIWLPPKVDENWEEWFQRMVMMMIIVIISSSQDTTEQWLPTLSPLIDVLKLVPSLCFLRPSGSYVIASLTFPSFLSVVILFLYCLFLVFVVHSLCLFFSAKMRVSLF